MQKLADIPGSGNIDKICLGDPSIPVVLEGCRGSGPSLELTERPLVDDIIISCCVEETGRDPWL
jgi:hypothetical protein